MLAEADAPSDDPRIWIAAPLEAAGRCETVLNSTLAEMNEYHDAKAADFRALTGSYIDTEIAHHEAVLANLKAARAAFEPSADANHGQDGLRRPSALEDELANPSQGMKTDLRQPSAHVSHFLRFVRPALRLLSVDTRLSSRSLSTRSFGP